jgi:hypothetical protein
VVIISIGALKKTIQEVEKIKAIVCGAEEKRCRTMSSNPVLSVGADPECRSCRGEKLIFECYQSNGVTVWTISCVDIKSVRGGRIHLSFLSLLVGRGRLAKCFESICQQQAEWNEARADTSPHAISRVLFASIVAVLVRNGTPEQASALLSPKPDRPRARHLWPPLRRYLAAGGTNVGFTPNMLFVVPAIADKDFAKFGRG